jgi:hypothetical protein
MTKLLTSGFNSSDSAQALVWWILYPQTCAQSPGLPCQTYSLAHWSRTAAGFGFIREVQDFMDTRQPPKSVIIRLDLAALPWLRSFAARRPGFDLLLQVPTS